MKKSLLIFLFCFLFLSFVILNIKNNKDSFVIANIKETLEGINPKSFKANNLDQNSSSFIEIQEKILKQIPSHIDIYDFYSTYGKRLLGDENLKIYSREEWKIDQAEEFYNKKFQNKIIEDTDPEINLEILDYWRLKEIIVNYYNNFFQYDNFFLKNLTKENSVIYQYLPVEEIVIHHTGGRLTYSFEDSVKEIQRIYITHKYLKGWSDIGYHFLIDNEGRIFEGTLGGKYSVGSHTFYHNKGTIGIALMGDFRQGHDQMSEKMKDSLIKLIQYLVKEYHFNLSEKDFYLRKPDFSSREFTNKFIKGHKELDFKEKPTDCPGIDLFDLRKIIYSAIFPENL